MQRLLKSNIIPTILGARLTFRHKCQKHTNNNILVRFAWCTQQHHQFHSCFVIGLVISITLSLYGVIKNHRYATNLLFKRIFHMSVYVIHVLFMNVHIMHMSPINLVAYVCLFSISLGRIF